MATTRPVHNIVPEIPFLAAVTVGTYVTADIVGVGLVRLAVAAVVGTLAGLTVKRICVARCYRNQIMAAVITGVTVTACIEGSQLVKLTLAAAVAGAGGAYATRRWPGGHCARALGLTQPASD